MIPPWVGAWEWLSEDYDGRPAYTERYFCFAFAQKVRQAPAGRRISDAEASALFRSFGGAAAGSHIVKKIGDEWLMETVTLTDLLPENVGNQTEWALGVEGDLMSGQIIGADGTRSPVPPFSYRRLSQQWHHPISGAWELVSDTWVGLMISTDTEYRYIRTRKDRPQIMANPLELSDADAAVLYHSFDAQCGSQVVSGSTLYRIPVVVKDPRDKGSEIRMNFEVNGKFLSIGNDQQEFVWRRV